MLCEQAETLLALFALDEMEPGPRSELQAHLDACGACREKLGDIRVTVGLLQEAVARQPVPRLGDERRAALLRQVAEEGERPGARSRPAFRLVRRIGVRLKESLAATRFGWGSAAACVVILLILAGLMLPSLSRAREEGRRAVCKENASQVGKAMSTFEVAESPEAPPTPSAPAASTRPGERRRTAGSNLGQIVRGETSTLPDEYFYSRLATPEALPTPSASPSADSPVRGGDLTRSKENLEQRSSLTVNGLGTTGEHPGGATGGGLLADGRIWHDFDVDDASNSAGGDSLKSKTEYWAADKSGRKSGDMAGEAGQETYGYGNVPLRDASESSHAITGDMDGTYTYNSALKGDAEKEAGQVLFLDGAVKFEASNYSSNVKAEPIYRHQYDVEGLKVTVEPDGVGYAVDVTTGKSAFSSAQKTAPRAETEAVAKRPEPSAPLLAHVPVLKRVENFKGDLDSPIGPTSSEYIEKLRAEAEEKAAEAQSREAQKRPAGDAIVTGRMLSADEIEMARRNVEASTVIGSMRTFDVVEARGTESAATVDSEERRKRWAKIYEADKRNREDNEDRNRGRLLFPGSTIMEPTKEVWDAICDRERGASIHAQKTLGLIEGRDESERAEKAAGGTDEEQGKMYVVLTPEDTASIDKREPLFETKKALTRADIAEPVPAPEPDATKIEDDLPAPVFKAGPVNPWVMTSEDALSTFGIDVDTASYSIARGYIRRGYLPPPASVRMEEFVNAFDYNYSWNHDRVFTTHVEAAPAPFGRGLTLVKVGIRGKVIGRDGRKPVHLVFVVDASGSMARTDRIPLVQYALKQLVSALDPADTISLVIYNTRASLVLETVPVARRDAIISAIDAIRCGGSTNLYEGLKLGYGVAARGFRTGGVNRVILCSDGVANVGSDDADEMLANVETFRKQGIAFTAAGIGSGAYNDVLMERLADRGDGNYVFVDSEAEARRVFVEDMAATLQTIAKDVKIQVAFDPARVRRYRLIGFENRDIADADFRNDAVDAGEIGSGQSATALYEVELLPPVADEPVNDLGTVYVRYRDLETDKVEEISHRIESGVVRSRAVAESPRFYLAACAAEFAEILRESEHAADGNLDKVRSVMERVAIQLPLDKRVQELLQMVRTAKGLPKAE